MALFTLDELTTPLETEELKASVNSALATVGVTTTTWKPGAVVRTIIAICCVILHALSVLISNIAKMGFLELASGLWLRLKARYDFGVDYQAATFAAGTVLVSNSSGGLYSLDPGDLELACSITGKSYLNTAAVVIGIGASNVPVAVQAVEAGAASSALIGEVDTVVTALNGLSCTNAMVLVGLDDETDEALKTRSLEKLGSFSPNGPADAYSYAAKTAVRSTNGSAIGVNRVRVVPDGLGGVDVYCATASGLLSAPDLTDVDEAIQTQAAPLAVTARVHNATPVTVNVDYSAWAYNTTGLTEPQIESAIAAALQLYMAEEPIGGNEIVGTSGKIYRDDISAEISRAKYNGTAALRVFRCNVNTPSADVAIAVNEFPVLGAVAADVTRVAPSRGML